MQLIEAITEQPWHEGRDRRSIKDMHKHELTDGQVAPQVTTTHVVDLKKLPQQIAPTTGEKQVTPNQSENLSS